MIIVEVGFKLDKNLEYYDDLLKENGLINDFNCITHDIYYTNKKLDGMSENEMKQACIRLRCVNNGKYKVQNNCDLDLNEEFENDKLNEIEEKLIKAGYHKIFDTTKMDHHYFRDGMTSKIQIQEIDDVGLLVYFDNKKYYKYNMEKQRNMLIDELNIYGFNFKYSDLGLDKLRTLYYHEPMYSMNQNG